MTTLDPVPEITKIVTIIECADGRRMRWEADNERPLTRLEVEARYVDPDIEFRLPGYADQTYFPNRSVELKFSTNDEARLTLVPEDDTLIDPNAGDAAESAVRAWECFINAKDPLAQAHHLVNLANHMSDLASWVPPEEYEG
jgi:hypothetical protein